MGCLKLEHYLVVRPACRNTGSDKKQASMPFFYITRNGGFQYVYASNNPITMIDLDGMEGVKPDDIPQVVQPVDPKGGLGHSISQILPFTDSDGGEKVETEDDKKKITIDPGHGDHHDSNKQIDPGSVNGLDYEKDIVVQIANSVNKTLTDSGYSITMTRTGDKENAGEKLQWRIDAAEGTDIFVSIHVNASKNETAKGYEVYYKADKTGTDESKLLNAESKSLAQSIQDENTLFSDRGIKEGGSLGVLNKFNGVAVLVEAGFISNASDLDIMKTKAEQIGVEIARGIMNYLNKK